MKGILCLLLLASLAFASALADASETKPARLLAVFVVDTNEKDLTVPFGY